MGTPLAILVHDFGGNAQPIELGNSECLFIVGRNGSGKSSLIQHIYASNRDTSHWIPALRQNALSSSQPSMTPAQRDQFSQNLDSWNLNPQARYWDHGAASRPDAAMLDLLEKRNQRNSEIAHEVDGRNTKRAKKLSKQKKDPLTAMSSLLASAGLRMRVEVEQGGFIAVRPSGERYSIDRLSDGERNVFLLCCEVLTVPSGTAILIDEPERHLHRAISSSLLANLMQERPDCPFIVATNDLELTSTVENSQILILRDHPHYKGDVASAWEFSLIEHPSEIDEQTRLDILGARERVVFVEGERDSLDFHLYSKLFPDVSIIPKGNRRSVEGAVRSIREASDRHWVKAFGIVDGDGDQANPVPHTDGVLRIPCDSVESIYLDEHLQRQVAERKHNFSSPDDPDIDGLVKEAREKALATIRSSADEIAKRVAARELHREWESHRPNAKTVDWSERATIKLEAPSRLAEAKERLDTLTGDGDIFEYIRTWPTKRTPIPSAIARALGLHDLDEYYWAVQRLLQDDEDARKYVIGLLGELPTGLLPPE